MRTLRFHAYGEPSDVLRLETAPVPMPNPGSIRVRVSGCGLNPADWALCGGLFAGNLPRGIGLDVSGVIDAIGAGVSDVDIGDAVLGPANYADYDSAGAADFSVSSRMPSHSSAVALTLPRGLSTKTSSPLLTPALAAALG